MSNNRHSRSGHQVHPSPCWSGQVRSDQVIRCTHLPLVKCVYNGPSIPKAFSWFEDMVLKPTPWLWPMPGWSHGPDGPVRTSGHRPVGRPAGRSGDVRAGLTVACRTRTRTGPDPPSGRSLVTAITHCSIDMGLFWHYFCQNR